jgi:hypothetical protein
VLSLGGGVAAGLFIAACIDQGLVCVNGLTRCGQSCADLSSDRHNCGACGLSCQTLQVCTNSVCQCEAGAVLCNGTCTATFSDPLNCGGCAGAGGVTCRSDQVCADGGCLSPCSLERLTFDRNNCGYCGHVCGAGQNCHAGSCGDDVVAACLNNGTAVGVQAATDGGTDFLGNAGRIGSSPRALATLPNFPNPVLLVADSTLQQLVVVDLESLAPRFLDAGFPTLDASPNHIWVEDPYIYVANSSANKVQIFQRVGSAYGLGDGGLQLVGISDFYTGMDTSPQAIAKIGNLLYVPLRGTASNPDAGQKVAQINIFDPVHPFLENIFDLGPLTLDAGSIARPSAVVAVSGALYVALNNLGPPPTSDPVSPGLLAKIVLPTGPPSPVSLGSLCLNAGWLATSSDGVYVSCSGKVAFDGGAPISTQGTEIAALNAQDQVVATWTPACPGGMDAGCVPPSIGRFAILGNRLYVGEQLGGRLFVVERVGAQLLERRGYATDGGPLLPCPDAGTSAVSDVIAVP